MPPLAGVGQGRHAGGQAPHGVVGDDLVDEVADGGGVAVAGVQASLADQLADLALDDLVGGLLAGRGRGHGVVGAGPPWRPARTRRRLRRAGVPGTRATASPASACCAGQPSRASRSAWPASRAASTPARS